MLRCRALPALFCFAVLLTSAAQGRQIAATESQRSAPTWDDYGPVWSPDGTRIAFSSVRGGKYDVPNDDLCGDLHLGNEGDYMMDNHDVYVLNADGSNERRLTTDRDVDEAPTWSPDGRRIAFESYRDCNGAEIFVMNADGTNQRPLTRNKTSDLEPAWSPDGRRIAFDSRRNSHSGIFVMNADGSNQHRLTRTIGVDTSPAWSPDGRRIAFGSNAGTLNFDIYVVNADGSDKRRLTWNKADDHYPAWSPDGRRIAFTRFGPGYTGEIYLMNDGGSTQRPLTAGSMPAWSPDGRRIAFRGVDGGIYVTNADGTHETRLTN